MFIVHIIHKYDFFLFCFWGFYETIVVLIAWKHLCCTSDTVTNSNVNICVYVRTCFQLCARTYAHMMWVA